MGLSVIKLAKSSIKKGVYLCYSGSKWKFLFLYVTTRNSYFNYNAYFLKENSVSLVAFSFHSDSLLSVQLVRTEG